MTPVNPGLHAHKNSGRMSRQNAHRLEPLHTQCSSVLLCCLHQRTQAILQQEAASSPSTAARSSMHERHTGSAQIARPKWRSAACAHARQYCAQQRPAKVATRTCCINSASRDTNWALPMAMYPCQAPATLAITAGLKYRGQHTHNVPHKYPPSANTRALVAFLCIQDIPSHLDPLGCRLCMLVNPADKTKPVCTKQRVQGNGV
jgi:hypothetical protein